MSDFQVGYVFLFIIIILCWPHWFQAVFYKLAQTYGLFAPKTKRRIIKDGETPWLWIVTSLKVKCPSWSQPPGLEPDHSWANTMCLLPWPEASIKVCVKQDRYQVSFLSPNVLFGFSGGKRFWFWKRSFSGSLEAGLPIPKTILKHQSMQQFPEQLQHIWQERTVQYPWVSQWGNDMRNWWF